MSQVTSQAGSARVGPAVLAALAVAVVGAASVSMAKSMGYDEAMHAELPAARMLVAVELGEWGVAGDTLQACQQYPFVYPLVLALVQAFTGVSELACRMSGRVAWGIALLGIFLVARQVAAAVSRERGNAGALDARAAWTPWIAFALAALSPAAWAFSGTLFLEVPFLAVATFALHAWLRRGGEHAARRDVIAGALLALALFTKFNYGGLLAAGCALDLALEGVAAARAGNVRAWILSASRVALVPLATCLWWFVLPFPAGLATAATHREAFLGFLAGNQQLGTPAPFALRLFDWGAGVFASPRALFVAVLGALAALRFVRVRAVRTLWIVGLACTLPVVLHPYHLDRLLLPSAPYLWILAAVGLGSLLSRKPGARIAAVAALLVACLVLRNVDSGWLMDRGFPPSSDDPAVAAYRAEVLEEKLSLSPARGLPTAGLPRAESDAALDALAKEAGDAPRIGWLGAMEKLPPAALQVGLLARGGSPRRWLEDLVDSMLFGVEPKDPGLDAAQWAQRTSRFDLIFSTDPPDAFGSSKWAFLAAYRERLAREQGFAQHEFARISLQPPLGPPRSVGLIALRRTP